MFLGEIVAAYGDENCLDNGTPDALKVEPTVMIAAGYFWLHDRVGSVFKACSGSKQS